jgi:hypothetical protein
MGTPGFTADVSLYKTGGRYRMAAGVVSDLYAEQIRPQSYVWSGGRWCIPDCVCVGPDVCPCCGSFWNHPSVLFRQR